MTLAFFYYFVFYYIHLRLIAYGPNSTCVRVFLCAVFPALFVGDLLFLSSITDINSDNRPGVGNGHQYGAFGWSSYIYNTHSI